VATIFLECADIKGESKKVGYEEQIECESWSWAASHSGGLGLTGKGGSQGSTSVAPISLSKYQDKSSHTLFQYLCEGKHAPEMKLHITRTEGGVLKDYMTITMTEVIVENWSISGGSDQLPVESVSLMMGKVKVETFVQDDKGALSNAGDFTWNCLEHTKE